MKAGVLLILTLALGGDHFAEGIRAYQEGRHQDALAAFTAAEEQAGHDASAALLYDRALAALRAGRLVDAEFSAEKAAARGGDEFTGLRDFLLGSAAFMRCLRAELEASLPDAEPTAYARAIRHAEAALEFWQNATASRSDWPAARRNAERALLKLQELQQKKAEADANQDSKKAKPPEQQPTPPDLEPDPEQRPEQQPVPQQDPGMLTTAQLAKILDKLAEKEAEKRKLRRAQQQRPSVRVEKDW